jgi:diguanylate cyclase (GGDEF)-like protein
MTATLDFLRYGNIAAFCILAIACVRQLKVTANRVMRWAIAAFGSLATIALIGLALQQPDARPLATWFVKGMLVVLILFPYFLYRFATVFERPRWYVDVSAHVSTAVVVVWSCALPYFPRPNGPQPTWWSGYRTAILIQWTILFLVVAARLWGAGRGEARVTRLRMRILALGAGGMDAAVLLSGVAKAPQSSAVMVVTQATFLLCAVLFYVALAAPAWLVHIWRQPEVAAFQATMRELFRVESEGEVADLLLPQVTGVLGARGAALVIHSGELVAVHGSTADEAELRRLALSDETRPDLHRVRMRHGTLLLWTSPYAPFFGQTEFATADGLGVFADIVIERCLLAARRREAERAIAHQATHDALTGLPNRSLFVARLIDAQAGLEWDRTALAVLFLDLDRFKLVNDAIDHSAGDELLKAVAERLAGSLRSADTVARFGGDEFVLFGYVHNEAEALALGRRTVDALHAPFQVCGRDVSVTASVGVVVVTAPSDPAVLVRNADVAMYKAKENGRARVELFDEQTRQASVDRAGLERDLRQAVNDKAIVLHYQPVVRLADGAVTGVEALARWPHPRLGWLGPSEFIPIAEESGLIADIGTLAIQEACRQAREWRNAFGPSDDFTVWVNVSGAQFRRMDVPAVVAAALRAHDLPPRSIGLEITESVFIDQTDSLAAGLRALGELGALIAIDDFGTGFSSLSRLKNLRADVIKIDGSFVSGLGHAREDSAIVAACVALANALGVAAVAECVETELQLSALTAEGCGYGQGFLFSRPLPAAEATEYLRTHQAGGHAPLAINDLDVDSELWAFAGSHAF